MSKEKRQYFKKLSKKIYNSKFGFWLICRLLSFYITICYVFSKRIISKEDKIKLLSLNKDVPVIFLFWHSRSLYLPYFRKKFIKKDCYGFFSDHKDGAMISRLFNYQKIKSIIATTNSTTKSVGGLKQALKVLRNNQVIGFTPDGPVGPRFRITTNSALFLAQKTGALIVPLLLSSSRNKISEKSWDKYMMPRPFGKIQVKVGQMVKIPTDLTDEEFENRKLRIEKEMIELTQSLDKTLMNRVIEPETYENSRQALGHKYEAKE